MTQQHEHDERVETGVASEAPDGVVSESQAEPTAPAAEPAEPSVAAEHSGGADGPGIGPDLVVADPDGEESPFGAPVEVAIAQACPDQDGAFLTPHGDDLAVLAVPPVRPLDEAEAPKASAAPATGADLAPAAVVVPEAPVAEPAPLDGRPADDTVSVAGPDLAPALAPAAVAEEVAPVATMGRAVEPNAVPVAPPAPATSPATMDGPALTRRAARHATKRRTVPVIPVLLTLLVLAALSYGGYQTVTAVTDLALTPTVARAVLIGQTLSLLLVAVAGILAVLLADRRAAQAAKNPTLDQALADLAAARAETAAIAAARDEAVASGHAAWDRIAEAEARVEAAAVEVRTAIAVRDEARADLARYMGERPPSEAEIRARLAEEFVTAHQASLADLHQAHERMVASLRASIADAEAAAARAEDGRAAAEASVAAACERTRAEERARLRITVQALSADAHATMPQQAAVAVDAFAARFVSAVDRLDPAPVAGAAMPVRAVPSSRPAMEVDDRDETKKKRRAWRR